MIDRSAELQYVLDGLKSGLLPAFDFPAAPDKLHWSEVVKILQASRLAAHFYVLGQKYWDEWPAEFKETLLRDRISLSFYSNQCSVKVRGVLSALHEAQIPVIVLKGWAYIHTIYKADAAQRVCEDIDILVAPQYVDAVEKIFASLSMYIDPESWPGYSRRYANAARYFFEPFSDIPGSTFSIGLHWGLLNTPSYDPKRMNVDDIFLRASYLKVAGIPVLQLFDEDHLVYACAHAGLHHPFDATLFREYELAHLILSAEINWKKVIERATEWQCILPVLFMLQRVRSLWDGVVPDSIIADIQSRHPSFTERFSVGWIRLFRNRKVFDHLLVWLTFPVWYQRPLIALQDIFPSPEYMRQRYGSSQFGQVWWFYVIRFFQALKFLVR